MGKQTARKTGKHGTEHEDAQFECRCIYTHRLGRIGGFEAATLVLDAIFRDKQWLADLAKRPGGEDLRHVDWGLRSRWRLLARLLELG